MSRVDYDRIAPLYDEPLRQHSLDRREEVVGWRGGPDLLAALDLAEAQGWHAYDRELGEAPGEYAIVHLKRERPSDGASP